MTIKEVAKKIRVSQPFNRIVTDSLKFLFADGTLTPDLILKYLPRIGEVQTRLPGGKEMKLWSYGDEQVTNYIYWRGWKSIEPETKTVFLKLAAESRITFDVGAHIGSFALLAAITNPNCKVFAFEPMPLVYQRLIRNVAMNELTNITCLPMAAGTHDHESDFYHVPEGVPSSSSLSYSFMSRPGVTIVSTKVKVIALDHFMEENALPYLDLVKMDTEETEPDVLRGMEKTLQKHKPKIICEVLRKENEDIESFLGPLGYRYYLLTGEGPILRKKIEGGHQRDNYLFTTAL